RSHARKRRGHWLLGSVARVVVHKAPAPVLLLRQPMQRKPPSVWSTVPPHQTFDLLIALDGSPLAEAVLDPAVSLVRALAGEKPIQIHLVHVVRVNPIGLDTDKS